MNNIFKLSLKAPSIIALIIANLVPLFGVLFFDWTLFSIILIYWMENVVIGFYNILKMAKASGPTPASVKVDGKPAINVKKSFFIIFFILHFGVFTVVHGMFIFFVFGLKLSPFSFDRPFIWPVVSLWGIILTFLMLFVSHGISYINNFVNNEEYKKISPAVQMFKPYGRVIVMHLVTIGAAFLLSFADYTPVFITIIIILKIILDIFSHRWEHPVLGTDAVQIQYQK